MNIFKNNIVVGITAGLAASILAPILIPAAKRSARPLAKALIKGGMVVYEKGREAVASTGEMIEDVVAEIRAEEDGHDQGWEAGEAPDRSVDHAAAEHDADEQARRGAMTAGNGESPGVH